MARIPTALLAISALLGSADLQARTSTVPQSLAVPLSLTAPLISSGWLGVYLAENEARPVVDEVVPNSPAAKAGIRAGDTFLTANGKKIASVDQLIAMMGKLEAGTKVKFVLLRGGKEVKVGVRLGKRPDEGAPQPKAKPTPLKKVKQRAPTPTVEIIEEAPRGAVKRAEPPYLGLALDETKAGLRVLEALKGGPAAKAGLRKGDRITEIADKKMGNLGDLDRLFTGLRAGQKVEIEFVRDGKDKDVEVRLGRRPGSKATDKPRTKSKKSKKSKSAAKSKPSSKASKSAAKAKLSSKASKSAAKSKPSSKASKSASKSKLTKSKSKSKLTKPKSKLTKSKPSRLTRPQKAAAVTPERYRKLAAKPDSIHVGKPWGHDLKRAQQAAKKSGKSIILVFGADWCVNCHALLKSFADASVKKQLSRYEAVWLDAEKQSKLADKYGVQGLPHIAILVNGKPVKTMTGYYPAEHLAKSLAAHGKKSDRRVAAKQRDTWEQQAKRLQAAAKEKQAQKRRIAEREKQAQQRRIAEREKQAQQHRVAEREKQAQLRQVAEKKQRQAAERVQKQRRTATSRSPRSDRDTSRSARFEKELKTVRAEMRKMRAELKKLDSLHKELRQLRAAQKELAEVKKLLRELLGAKKRD